MEKSDQIRSRSDSTLAHLRWIKPVTDVLILHDQPELYVQTIQDEFPFLTIKICGNYADLGKKLDIERPQALLAFKLSGGPFPRETILESPWLKWLHVAGAGIDHVLPWDPNRLIVTNSSGIHGTAIAEYVLTSILMNNQRTRRYFDQQLQHQWRKHDSAPLEGQTLVILGLGRIGCAVAERARSAGLRVIGVNTTGAGSNCIDDVYPFTQLKAALATADHVAVTLPYTTATRCLINREAIDAMKPGALLINVSRGGIVDETALLEAVRELHLGGAVLDVFATEPLPPDSPLWDEPNIVVTPHISGDVVGWQLLVAELFSENLRRSAQSHDFVNVVDPARGY